MKPKTAQKAFPWILLALVSAEFAFLAWHWLSYCPPLVAAQVAFSGAWFKEPFQTGSAGTALDQPTVGKFFLWTSVMACLACTITLLLRVVAAGGGPALRCWVNAGTTALLALVLIELLAPTLLLVQYVVSMGMTPLRFLGLGLCCGFWILLPSVIFQTWKANPPMAAGIRSPLFWAFACSLVAPTWYVKGVFHLSAWRHWNTAATGLALAWVALIVQGLCGMWLLARRKVESDNGRMPDKLPRATF